ncbi:SRPBCC family protein [Actimicrobium antarcticum]|uniref:Coenzyme Q-binding protein COQ10 START domain-containing protein n=1 Tax=Actimicrobium antarcticum TaxID=1051899 RepID=A0ABP7T2W1_9BURK
MHLARFVSLSLLGLMALPAHASEALDVMVVRNRTSDQAFFDIRASGFTRATPERVWQVLTDYERQPDYVPNLTAARVVSRNGTELVLEQDGRGGFFLFKRAIHLKVRILEKQPSSIDVALISGDMKRYSARWLLTPAEQSGAAGTRIDYSGSIEPDFFVPPVLGNAIVRADIRKMMEAVITELDQ